MHPPLHIEIVLKSKSTNSRAVILPVVQKYLEKCKVQPNSILSNFNKNDHPILHNEVQFIVIGDLGTEIEHLIDFNSPEIKWYVYTLDTYGPLHQTSDDDEDLIYGTHFVLPSADLFNIWENLYYDSNIKENLLKYAHTMMEFSDKGVDYNVVSCNRVILLHGPPGTGKTSLCKALAQKLAIRMQERYSSAVYIEIRSDCLFSKFFSESVKLVTKMFTKIKEVVDNPNVLVCVLIDEVESLAHARDQCRESDPSDSIKVVNAVLTQIDQIKKYPNVLIFATSNMTDTIDLAFVDRADIKQYLGLPSVPAIYKIYHSCIKELVKAQIINCKNQHLKNIDETLVSDNEISSKLLELCRKSSGLSGRCLRKIPFIAHALFMKQTFGNLSDFLDAMEKAVEREHKEREYFKNKV